MPGVDLLDAFAELVVRVVFSLPHTEPDRTSSSDEDAPYGASSSTTQIFSRTTSLEDEQQPNDTPLAHISMNNVTRLSSSAGHAATLGTSCNNSISRGSSAASLDLYPGGIWNALARAPAAAAGNAGRSSHPSSVVSIGTGDNPSTPRSGAGLWSRFLGGSGRTQSPPRTGLTTTASSFVQLTDEELAMGAAASSGDGYGSVGAAHRVGGGGGSGMWVGYSITPTNARSNDSTPLREAQPQPWMGPHGLYLSRSPTQSGSGNGGQPSRRSSSSEFDIL
ncbi:hypothetical protein LSCM1_08205 [Leishmania martiniquensis]|uniref:Uncharacterized protein n=1 Tax=Leishmania martiniquensis TaxID=1580590 RepID=A0A836KWB7_9TRYP|nr:hypothetical protein LSCM1_08205 [Leishmania martiniquensis]